MATPKTPTARHSTKYRTTITRAAGCATTVRKPSSASRPSRRRRGRASRVRLSSTAIPATIAAESPDRTAAPTKAGLWLGYGEDKPPSVGPRRYATLSVVAPCHVRRSEVFRGPCERRHQRRARGAGGGAGHGREGRKTDDRRGRRLRGDGDGRNEQDPGARKVRDDHDALPCKAIAQHCAERRDE